MERPLEETIRLFDLASRGRRGRAGRIAVS